MYVVVDMMRIKNRMFWSRETSRQDCRESSRIFRNDLPYNIQEDSWHSLLRSSTFSCVYDLCSPLADDRKKSRRPTTDNTSTMTPSTTALTQQPAWDSRCAGVDTLRKHHSINRCRRTVDCCIVAFVIAIFLPTHRRSRIDQPGLIFCKIADPPLVVRPTNWSRFDSRAQQRFQRLFLRKNVSIIRRFIVIIVAALQHKLTLYSPYFILHTLTECRTIKII